MVELKGTHRFNDCPDMKTIMPNMRDGVLSSKDWEILNSRIKTTINLETLVIRNQRTTLARLLCQIIIRLASWRTKH
jgi:hypothetical protein